MAETEGKAKKGYRKWNQRQLVIHLKETRTVWASN